MTGLLDERISSHLVAECSAALGNHPGSDATGVTGPDQASRVSDTVPDSHGALRNHVRLDCSRLRHLRHSRLMSQQELADDCWRRNIQLSLTTIKRAELGRAVRFRIAREFARYFGIAAFDLIRSESSPSAQPPKAT